MHWFLLAKCYPKYAGMGKRNTWYIITYSVTELKCSSSDFHPHHRGENLLGGHALDPPGSPGREHLPKISTLSNGDPLPPLVTHCQKACRAFPLPISVWLTLPRSGSTDQHISSRYNYNYWSYTRTIWRKEPCNTSSLENVLQKSFLKSQDVALTFQLLTSDPLPCESNELYWHTVFCLLIKEIKWAWNRIITRN